METMRDIHKDRDNGYVEGVCGQDPDHTYDVPNDAICCFLQEASFNIRDGWLREVAPFRFLA